MPNRIIPYNPALKALARKLRTESTLGEILLWTHIRRKALGVEFHRQLPIDNYIVDFYCHELLLAIEIDGDSHNDEAIAANDTTRQTRLESLGVKFIHFTEQDVRHNIPEVLAKLKGMIEHLQSQK